MEDKSPSLTIKNEFFAALFAAVITMSLDLASNYNGVLYLLSKFFFDNILYKYKIFNQLIIPFKVLIKCLDSALLVVILYFILYISFDFTQNIIYSKSFQTKRKFLRSLLWENYIPRLLDLSELENQFINSTPNNNSLSYWIIELSAVVEKHLIILRKIENKGFFELITDSKAISRNYKKFIQEINFMSIYCLFVNEHRLICEVIKVLQQLSGSANESTLNIVIEQYEIVKDRYYIVLQRLESIKKYYLVAIPDN